jgi:hypothetical protein
MVELWIFVILRPKHVLFFQSLINSFLWKKFSQIFFIRISDFLKSSKNSQNGVFET